MITKPRKHEKYYWKLSFAPGAVRMVNSIYEQFVSWELVGFVQNFRNSFRLQIHDRVAQWDRFYFRD